MLNVLSVGAAYGVLVAVFQWAGAVAARPHGTARSAWLPLFLFVILFGLSMDYHVFVSRIREGHDRGLPTARGDPRRICARPA